VIWRGSLFVKYAVPLVILVSGALVVSGLVEIYFSYQENKSALARIQHEKAAAAAIRIEQFVRELEHDLSWIAQTPWGPRGIPLDQRRLDSLRLLRQVPAITEVGHIDPSGHEQLRVSRLAMDVIGSNADLSSDPKFKEAMARKTWFSPVYFRKESEPYMTIAMAGAGEDAGVVAAEANLKFIWDVVSNLRIGKGGNAYVVDEHGRLIAHPDISLVLQKTDLSALPQVRAAAATPNRDAGASVEAMIGRDVRGTEVLSAHATITPLNWSVFVELPITEAFASLYTSIWRTVILVLVGVVISIGASLFLVRRMVSPVQALRAGAARIGAGALEHRIAVQSGDELQALADEFNRMTERLQESYAGLERKVEERTRDLREALEQQTATSEVLKVISRSAFDLQPVLETLIENATRLCNASHGFIFRLDGNVYRLAVSFGASAEYVRFIEDHPIRPGRETLVGRTALARQTVHIPDVMADPEYGWSESQQRGGFRSMLGLPLLREGVPIGVVAIWREEVQPFSQKQIELVTTFADQAVIAIENVRLFKELEERNKALTESLEQQTATAEILRVISSSPTDLQPVYKTILENTTRLCESNIAALFLYDGEALTATAHHGTTQAFAERLKDLQARRPSHATPTRLAALERRVVHVGDLLSDPEFAPEPRELYEKENVRTVLSVPMLREGALVGVITTWRREIRPFSERQVALIQTFADQAVIAIENVRLFKELGERNKALTEALEQQTATSEILRVISSSPTDLQPVLDAVAQSAARLCAGNDAAIYRIDGEFLQPVATTGPLGAHPLPVTRTTVGGRAVVDRKTVHIEDIMRRLDTDFPDAKPFQAQVGFRTILATPLLREGTPIGAILIRRTEVRPFSEKQIELLKTFADQAVIAIENVRLFKELEERNKSLTEALEQQTATSEILRVISQSQRDVQPVFEAIAKNARKLCKATWAVFYTFDGELMRYATADGMNREATEATLRTFPMPPSRGSALGRAILTRATAYIPDVREDAEYRLDSLAETAGYRSTVSVPILRDDSPIGAISVSGTEPSMFSERQIAMLQTFADQAVIAIENARLFQQLQDRTQDLGRSVGQLQALADVSQAVNSTLDLEQVLSAIVTRAVQLSSTDTGAVYEHDEISGELRLRATYGIAPELVDALLAKSLRVGEGATGRAAETRAAVEITDIKSTDAYSGPLRDVIERAEVRSILAVPLLREEHVLGGLTVSRKIAGSFPPGVIDILQTFAAQSAIAIQNARLFREIEQKGHELEIASQHKSQFLANMSHELRTPLNAILGYTELIVDQIYGKVPEKIRDVLERVQKSGRHLLGLINDVLDLSKIEAGQLTLSLSDYSFQDAVQSVVSSVESLAKEKGLRLTVEVTPKLPVGLADERRVVQVLLNLVGNAIKFTDAGEVGIRVNAVDDAFVVSVSDTGPGIPKSQHERIFEEFQQVDGSSTRAKGGTGLGLAIAKKIIELHGGRIWVESVVGKGSTFTFSLPVRAERREEVA
jgi:GAF domain-containing protein